METIEIDRSRKRITPDEAMALKLAKGSHPSRDNGLCALEVVAWMSGEPHSDHPQCVPQSIGAFGRAFNDLLSDERRTSLLAPILPKMIGAKKTPEAESRRMWLAIDWLIREFTATWLRLAKLDAQADVLTWLPEITNLKKLKASTTAISDAKTKAAAAVVAAVVAARDSAVVAARTAATDCFVVAATVAARDSVTDDARAAARTAAWASGGAAARAAALDSARAAVRAAAVVAATDAATDAVTAAAWDVADAARAVATDAARASAWDAATVAAWDAVRAARDARR